MAIPVLSRFAFAYGMAFGLLYVIARAYGLALFTVYPSLGVVLLGMHRSRDVADPALGFLAPQMWWYGWVASRDRLCRHVVAGSLVARVLAWVGVGHPFDRNDRVRLPDYSLVSTIAGLEWRVA
jgi:hypothetical protein